MSETASSTSLARSSGVMALGTAVSRITGFLRTVVLAAALGTALLADTYNVAHTVPTAIYILLLGGVLNAVFVPQLVRAMKESEDGGQGYADRLITLSGLVLLAVTVVATLAAPLVVHLYAQDFTERDYSVATAFAYWSLPQIFFYGVFTMLGQVLNARNRFGPMMWAPVLNNLVVIASGLLFLAVADVTRTGPDATASISPAEIALLGAGSTLGVVAQTLALVPPLRRSGYRFRLRTDFRGFGLGKAASLAKWTLLFVAANQLGYLVVTRVGTAVSAATKSLDYGAGFTAYQYAYLIFVLPHAIVTVSVVTALLPRMSRAAVDGRQDEVRDDLSYGLRLSGVAIVPAAASFVALGAPIAGVLYASAGARNAAFIGLVLTAFAPGLIFFTGHYIALRGFYAQEDTRTPFLVNVVINLVNVVLVLLASAVLPARFVTVALAASYSASYAVGMSLSLQLLRRRTGGIDGARVLRTYVRLVLAACAGAVPALLLARLVTTALGIGMIASLLALVVGGTALLLGYVAVARRLRVEELTSMVALARSKVRR